ncbi:MAG: peptidase MA family metallohydrolase [Bacillota bacterium]
MALVTQWVTGPLFGLHRSAKIGLVLFLLVIFALSVVLTKSPMLPKSRVYEVFRELAKIQMQWKTRHWEQAESAHFVVRYQPADAGVASLVLQTAEQSYRPVADAYKFAKTEKSLVIIYPTREELGRSFGWAADESAMGVYWAGVIRVLSPRQWIDTDDPQDMARVFAENGPMAHEFAHMVVDYRTDGNYTRWFTEGIAQYEEYRLTGFKLENERELTADLLYPFAQMDRTFDDLPDQGRAYQQSLEAVNYLVEVYGRAKQDEILDALAGGKTLNESFRSALGVDLRQFEADFRNWVAAK